MFNFTEEETQFSLKECDTYLNDKNKRVDELRPLSIYYILTKLKEIEQIKFIQNNIDYIKKYDEEIFLYNMTTPQALSYYFSFNVLKEIEKIDKKIFQKIIKGNYECLFNNFSFDDFINFINVFNEEIKDMNNWDFIMSLYCCNQGVFCGERIDYSISEDLYITNNKKIIDIILKKYSQKVKTFTPTELMNLLHFTKDNEQFKTLIIENKQKLIEIIKNPECCDFCDYLDSLSEEQIEFILVNFIDVVLENSQITETFLPSLNTNLIMKLCNQNKKLNFPLKQFLMSSYTYNIFNDDLKKILDEYKIEKLDSIENLFATNHYVNDSKNRKLEALEYVEMKFRNNIKITGNLEKMEEGTSIFSSRYLKNLKELEYLLKNNLITPNNADYQKQFKFFILYLKSRYFVINLDNESIKDIEKLFYKIVKGNSITVLNKIKNINDIVLYNRIGDINFLTSGLTLDQIRNYNVKQHKQLYSVCENGLSNPEYKLLTLKLMLLVGYDNAKKVLNIDSSINVLEHLLNSVDVKTIKLDECGNPILNDRIINILFNNRNKYLIKEMLENKEGELYKYFSRIFSEWELIKANHKDKTLDTILEYLKSDTISLPPEYKHLLGVFKYIGCSNRVVNETFSLHDEMLKRTETTIPKVMGVANEYSFEILGLQDIESLVVGNKTDCCFTVLGNAYSCLKHACTSKNGRILVIRKNNELVAHSWIWRNGDLLCLDNIEISKSIKEVDFLDVYLKFADELINESLKYEGYDSCIKNVTIGYTNFDKPNEELKKYPCLISSVCNLEDEKFVERLGIKRKVINNLPQPIDEVAYTDSKKVQYLIKGNGIFNLGQSTYLYEEKVRETTKVLTLKNGTK